MVREEKTKLSDRARNSLKKIDFHDTFSTTNHIDSIEEITKKIFEYSPLWIKTLFSIRRFLTKMVGIETPQIREDNSPFCVGGSIGNFKIYSILQNEIIVGRDDSHLNFRGVITNHPDFIHYNIQVSTLVSYKNIKGRIYMFFISYFHKVVTKNMLKQVYRA